MIIIGKSTIGPDAELLYDWPFDRCDLIAYLHSESLHDFSYKSVPFPIPSLDWLYFCTAMVPRISARLGSPMHAYNVRNALYHADFFGVKLTAFLRTNTPPRQPPPLPPSRLPPRCDHNIECQQLALGI